MLGAPKTTVEGPGVTDPMPVAQPHHAQSSVAERPSPISRSRAPDRERSVTQAEQINTRRIAAQLLRHVITSSILAFGGRAAG